VTFCEQPTVRTNVCQHFEEFHRVEEIQMVSSASIMDKVAAHAKLDSIASVEGLDCLLNQGWIGIQGSSDIQRQIRFGSMGVLF
jgi:hypothetical protein